MKLFYCADCGAVVASNTMDRSPVRDEGSRVKVRTCEALRTSFGEAQPCGGTLHHVTPGMLWPST